MSFELTIKFRNSTSSYYKTALANANKFKIFTPSENKKELNELKIASDEMQGKITYFNNLWDIIRQWKGTEILLDNKIIDPKELHKINVVTNCAIEHKNAVVQEKHCKIDGKKEGWGCKLLTSIDRYSDSSYSGYYYYDKDKWYDFGDFINETEWKINKNRIKELLLREAKLKYLEFCPIYREDQIDSILDSLPNSIETEDSDFWEIKFEEDFESGVAEKIKTGIKPKTEEQNSHRLNSLNTEFNADDEEDVSGVRNIPNITYDEIGGIDSIIQKIREVIEIPFKNPGLFEHLGITPHKGILLYGPPGCGKTLIAKAIANQVKAHFISIKGPELISKWQGQSEENLRNIFDEGRKLQPTIIFFDELDSIAQSRSSEESLRFDSRFVNQLLTLMDGIEDYGDVKIIATTNRVELIDDALLRPGRFDYHIQVNKPTREGCVTIFNIQTKSMPIESGFDLEYFSSKLFGLTGAEIAFVAREAAYNCLRRNLKSKISNKNYNFENINYSDFIVKEEDFLISLKLLNRNEK